MGILDRRCSVMMFAPPTIRRFVSVLAVAFAFPLVSTGQSTSYTAERAVETGANCDITIKGLQTQLEAQAEQIRQLEEKLGTFSAGLGPGECNLSCNPVKRRLPVIVEETVPPCHRASSDEFKSLGFYATYDRGFAILPFDARQTPFELRVNGWIQFRHHGFARDVPTWTDNAGVIRDVRNRNAFDIERARLSFKGFALDDRLTYFYQLDGDSDGRHTVDFFDYWWAWQCNDNFRLQLGKRKVAASRHWLLGARRTRFADRPMATDFFRPDRTIGLWGLGRLGERGRYEIMVGNGYRTANLPNAETDDQFTYAVTQYFDPFGDFGGQVVDYDFSDTPLFRIGHSFVFSPTSSDQLANPLRETDFLRLSDGTRLNQVGALAPGVTVWDLDIYFYSVDMALKWRGWSVNSEVYFRWLKEIRADGPLPVDDLSQTGFYIEGGTFIVPRILDVNFRYSEVDGLFGRATEYAFGLNCYPLNRHTLKLTFDVTILDGSPLNNTASDILVGDDGVLFRTQFQAEF